MQNLLTCLNIIVPIFALVGLGCFLRKIHITNDNFIEVGSHILFYVVLPCSLFMNLYNSDFSTVFNPKLVLFVVITHVGTVLLLSMVMPHFFKDRSQCGIVIQGAFRGNMILLGLPLAYNMFGQAGMGPTSLVMAYTIPLYNILGVITLSVFSDEEDERKIHWGGILVKIFKNPLVIGTLVAVPFALLRIPLPHIITDTVSSIGGIGATFGLILLGAQIRLPSMRQNKVPIGVAVGIKLVIFPLAVMALAFWMGFNSRELGAVFILVSAPMSISSFVMANSMGHDGELAGQMVFVSTILSMITLLSGLYLLTVFGIL